MKIADDLTFVIPVRIDSIFRLRNLKSVVEFYSRHLASNFIILEADTKSRIPVGTFTDHNVQFLFEGDENPIFHRTKYINRLLKKTVTPYAAIWDTDAVCPLEGVKKAHELLLTDKSTMVYPYDGIFWQVNRFFSSCFHRTCDIDLLSKFPQPRVLMDGYHSVGGAFMVNIERYRKVGWENEHFIGWGPEDKERFKRLEILGDCPIRVDGVLYHLYHTRGQNSGDFNRNLALATKREYCNVCAMTPDSLRNYINGWKWTKI